MRANETIRTIANGYGIKIWQIADALGIHEATLIKRLRRELPQLEKSRIIAIIEHLQAEREQEAQL